MTTYSGNNYYADPAEMLEETVYSAGIDKENVIETIMDKIPLAILVTGIITALFGYVKFIFTGGYTDAIARFREYGLFSFDEGVFVNSTAGYLYNKYVIIPVSILLVIAIINSFRMMFATDEKKGLKVASVVMLILGIVGTLILAFIPLVTGNSLPNNVFMIIAIACNAMLIVPFVIVRKDPNAKPYSKRVLRAAALYYLGIPAAVWMVENIIGFGSIVIGLIVAGGAVILIFGLMSSGGEASSESSSSGSSYDNSRDIKKKQDRIDYLNKKADDYAYYNKRQAEGAWGYQYYDAGKNREVINDARKEAASLEKEIAKMRSK